MNKYKLFLVALIVLFIDRLIKYFVMSNLILLESIEIIKNFFNITYIKNDGIAFNMLSGNRIIILILTIIFVYLFYLMFIKGKKLTNFNRIIYGMLFGGILGNLLDRIVFKSVIDYFDFRLFGFSFPVFNFADIMIVISIFFIFIEVIRGEEYANNSRRK